MKNTVFTDVIKGIVSVMDEADAGLKKYATPEKTPYEKRKEWNEKTLAEIRAMPPKEAIKGLMRHRSK